MSTPTKSQPSDDDSSSDSDLELIEDNEGGPGGDDKFKKEQYLKYFTLNDGSKEVVYIQIHEEERKVTCLVCIKKFKIKKGYNKFNIKRHFETKHNDIFLKIVQINEPKKVKVESSPSSVTKVTEKDGAKILEIYPPPIEASVESKLEILQSIIQKYLSFCPGLYDHIVSGLAILGNWPKDIRRRQDIIGVLKFFDKEVPGRTKMDGLIKQRIKIVTEDKKEMIASLFMAGALFHMDSDKWKSPWGFEYISINISGLSVDWKYTTSTLGFVHFPGSRTAIDIKKKWETTLASYGIQPSRIGFIYTDGEQAMINAVGELSKTIKHFPCANHLLNLINKDVLNTKLIDQKTKQPYDNFYTKAVNNAHIILAPFALSSKRVGEMKKLLKKHSMKEVSFIFDMETRWWIKLKMMRRLLEILPAIVKECSDMSIAGVMKEIGIKPAEYPEWEKAYKWYAVNMTTAAKGKMSPLQQLIDVLSYGEVWSAMWETRNFPAMSLVYPGYKCLKNNWSLNSLQEKYSPPIVNVGVALQKNLLVRFDPYFTDGLLYAATLLDPLTFFVLANKSDENSNVSSAIEYMAHQCNTANIYEDKQQKKVYTQLGDTSSALTTISSSSAKQNTKNNGGTLGKAKLKIGEELLIFQSHIEQAAVNDTFACDFYAKLEKDLEQDGDKIPGIMYVAKNILGGKAGSSASEAVFSIAKHGFPAHRSTTDPDDAADRIEARFHMLSKMKIDGKLVERPTSDYTAQVVNTLYSYGLVDKLMKQQIKMEIDKDKNKNNTTTTLSSTIEMEVDAIPPSLPSPTPVTSKAHPTLKEEGDDIGDVQEELFNGGIITYDLSKNAIDYAKCEALTDDTSDEMVPKPIGEDIINEEDDEKDETNISSNTTSSNISGNKRPLEE